MYFVEKSEKYHTFWLKKKKNRKKHTHKNKHLIYIYDYNNSVKFHTISKIISNMMFLYIAECWMKDKHSQA